MTTWNIASSRFYSEIMTSLGAFFGMPDASESELHQSLQDAGSVAQITAKANEAATLAVSTKMDEFQTQLTAIQSKLDEVIAADAAKAEHIVELQGHISDATTAATEKDTALATQAETIKTLSSELAGLKVARPLSTTPAAIDPGIPLAANPSGNTNARVITNADLAQFWQN